PARRGPHRRDARLQAHRRALRARLPAAGGAPRDRAARRPADPGGRDHPRRDAGMTAPVWIVVTARMASARRPGKALADLHGQPLLRVLLDRMKTARGVAGVALATSVRPENDRLEELGRDAGVRLFRGDEDDV